MIINNIKIFSLDHQFTDGIISIENDKFVDIAYGKMCITDENSDVVVDGHGCFAIPGLVDIHFHGCVGVDFCNGTTDAIAKMAAYEASQGITSICPATMTFSEEILSSICKAASQFKPDKDQAQLYGINMEGPFISEAKKGAQNPKYIHKPDVAMFRRLQSLADGLIKLVDVAPETEGALAFIEAVKDDVTVSLAHTAADYDIAKAAFDRGAKHVTHLYNAMMPYAHRSPGVIGAACDDEKVMAELICDGVHIHPSAVRTTFKMFGDERIILISDTMGATGIGDVQGELGGLKVTVRGNLATLEDGTIAGSVTNLMQCLRRAVCEMGIPLESAVRCAAENPAKAIGIFDRVGSLEKGKMADIVLLDEQLEIEKVIVRGNLLNH